MALAALTALMALAPLMVESVAAVTPARPVT